MTAPRFDTLSDAASFVVQHHRLPSILAIDEVSPFIEFIFNKADGETPLPTLVDAFFRR